MTETIWKTNLKIEDEQYVQIPLGSIPLTVQAQRGVPCIWWKIKFLDAEMDDIKIYVYGTGHTHAEIKGKYLGTFQLEQLGLVYHVFVEFTKGEGG